MVAELLGFWQAHTPTAKTPTANYVVLYKKAATGNKHLHGQVSCELSARLYGADNWWVLLDSDC